MGRAEIQDVIICFNSDCSLRGSEDVEKKIRSGAERAGIKLRIFPFICFGLCENGPNIVTYPDYTIYSLRRSRTPDPDPDVEEIVEHILGGAKVDRLEEKNEGFREIVLGNIESGIIDNLVLAKNRIPKDTVS